jgi:hypothetical protein
MACHPFQRGRLTYPPHFVHQEPRRSPSHHWKVAEWNLGASPDGWYCEPEDLLEFNVLMFSPRVVYFRDWATVKGSSTVTVRLMTRCMGRPFVFSRDYRLVFGFDFWSRKVEGVRTEVHVTGRTTVPQFLAKRSGVTHPQLCGHVPGLFRRNLEAFLDTHANVLFLLVVARRDDWRERNRWILWLQFVLDGNSPGFLWGRKVVELATDLHDAHARCASFWQIVWL